MSDILDFPGNAPLDLDPDKVLEEAKGNYQQVLILGFNEDGLFDIQTSHADGGSMFLLLELARQEILRGITS